MHKTKPQHLKNKELTLGQTSGNVFGRSEPDFRLDNFEGLVRGVLSPGKEKTFNGEQNFARRKDNNQRNKMLDEFGKAKVVFQLLLWVVFHRDPGFVPQTTRPHCSRAHQTAGRPLQIVFAAPTCLWSGSAPPRSPTQCPANRELAASNVQNARHVSEKAEVTPAGGRPVCRHRFYV